MTVFMSGLDGEIRTMVGARLPAEAGSHTSRIGGFRLQAEGCGCRGADQLLEQVFERAVVEQVFGFDGCVTGAGRRAVIGAASVICGVTG